ncbi:MAG TPA: anti-sigma factor [Gemmatimonadales bacterium]|jgi:hypothetical protein|nr:anti-sigma factor [Gemmatimonadales bacterium]
MTSHDWFVEHRTAYVVRSLEPEEEGVFREHLRGCAECRRETDRLEEELAWLPMGTEPVAPRPGLTRMLVERALGRRHAAPRWVVPAALAASLVLAAGAWTYALRHESRAEGRTRERIAELEHRLAMTRDTLAIIRNATRVAQAAIARGGHRGQLIIFADEATHRWNVVVHGLPAPRRGEVCQFWFITDRGMVRGAELDVEQGGTVLFTVGLPASGGRVMGAALTIEPAGSPSPAPRGPELVQVMLEG